MLLRNPPHNLLPALYLGKGSDGKLSSNISCKMTHLSLQEVKFPPLLLPFQCDGFATGAVDLHSCFIWLSACHKNHASHTRRRIYVQREVERLLLNMALYFAKEGTQLFNLV